MIKKLLPSLVIATGCIFNANADSNILAKVRGQILTANKTASYSPDISGQNIAYSNKGVISMGFGVEAAANYFINDNMAIEASLGLIRNKLATPIYVSQAGVYTGTALGKNSKIAYFIPVAVLGQYYIAPDEQFSPYVGAGYGYTLVAGSSSLVKFKNLHGPVFQLGMDIWDNDDLGVNIDVKKYLMTSKAKVTYINNNGAPITGKYTLNPWVMSIGVGFKM